MPETPVPAGRPPTAIGELGTDVMTLIDLGLVHAVISGEEIRYALASDSLVDKDAIGIASRNHLSMTARIDPKGGER